MFYEFWVGKKYKFICRLNSENHSLCLSAYMSVHTLEYLIDEGYGIIVLGGHFVEN